MTTDQHTDRSQVDPRLALAELGGSSSADASMEAMLQRVAELAKRVVPGVADASVTLISAHRPRTAASTGRLALDLDQIQYGYGRGPCLEAALGAEVRGITDARADNRWPDFTRTAVARGALSSLSVPLPIREGLLGGLNLYAAEAAAFDAGTRAFVTTFGSAAAVAVHNRFPFGSTRELGVDLTQALRSRAVVDQATGIVMCRRHCDATRAFELITAAAQRSQRRLGHVAQSIVDSVSGPDGRSS